MLILLSMIAFSMFSQSAFAADSTDIDEVDVNYKPPSYSENSGRSNTSGYADYSSRAGEADKSKIAVIEQEGGYCSSLDGGLDMRLSPTFSVRYNADGTKSTRIAQLGIECNKRESGGKD